MSVGGTVVGDKSGAFGPNAHVWGVDSYAIGVADVGTSSVDADGGFAIGVKSFVYGDNSISIGHKVETDASDTNSYIFGSGLLNSQFVNNISNSIMFGMNSNVSTVFIGNSGGASNSYGNVGIGNITAPASLLHVRDQVRVGLASNNNGSIVFNNSSNTNTLTIQTGVTSPSPYTLTLPVAAPTANGQALVGTTGGVLSWADASANAWLITGNNNTNPTTNFLGTIDNVDLVFRTNNTAKMRVMAGGNVGIGTATPDGILHLLALSSTDTDLIIEKADAREGALIFDNNGTQSASIAYNSGEQMILENTIANNEIRFRVSNGTVTEVMTVDGADLSVGIGVSNPESKLHVDADDASSATETVALFTVGENTIERFVLRNNSTTNGAFAPMMGSVSRQTNDPAMLIQAEVDNGNDTGTEPAMTFQVRNDATTFTTRPLFRWEEPNTVRMQMNAGGNLGIGTTAPSGKLHVAGTLFANLSFDNSAPSMVLYDATTDEIFDGGTSSIQFKEDVENLVFDTAAFLNLRPVSFNWRPARGGKPDVGLIAQEVADVFPQLSYEGYKMTHFPDGSVLRDSIGLPVVDSTQMEVRGVRYHRLPVYLLAIARKQQQELTEMRGLIDQMQETLNSCCGGDPQMRLGQEEPLGAPESSLEKSTSEFILLVNDPNPFSDHTDIRYETADCQRCFILITDMNGRIVKRIPLSSNKGSVRVYSSEIGSGMFSYSIVDNGTIVKSAKMVSTR